MKLKKFSKEWVLAQRRPQHEANITFRLANNLISDGWNIELEFWTPLVVIDILVWDKVDETVRCGIEVKRTDTTTIHDCTNGTRQFSAYNQLPIQCFVCRGHDQVEYTRRRVARDSIVPIDLYHILNFEKRSRR